MQMIVNIVQRLECYREKEYPDQCNYKRYVRFMSHFYSIVKLTKELRFGLKKVEGLVGL
jgi:hypothetical protein